jgi:hypothetical protein
MRAVVVEGGVGDRDRATGDVDCAAASGTEVITEVIDKQAILDHRGAAEHVEPPAIRGRAVRDSEVSELEMPPGINVQDARHVPAVERNARTGGNRPHNLNRTVNV